MVGGKHLKFDKLFSQLVFLQLPRVFTIATCHVVAVYEHNDKESIFGRRKSVSRKQQRNATVLTLRGDLL